MKIAILGFGREGRAVLKFLKKSPQYKNAEIWILDRNPEVLSSIKYQVSGTQLGKNYLKNLEDFDIVFRSPGIPYMRRELINARKNGVKFSSVTKLFFERCPASTIGVTGTKGKGTTATLIFQILKKAGKKAHLVGNIGKPALDELAKIKKGEFVVYELSSFQLQDLGRSPHMAVILDIFPDHQENVQTATHGSHVSMHEYIEAKANICRFQKNEDVVFFLNQNKIARAIAKNGQGKKIPVSEKGFSILKKDDLIIRGLHNYRNAIATTKVAKYLKIPDKIIRNVITNFKGLPHRLEFVRKIKVSGDKSIEFYNDSFSTSPQPTMAAIRAFQDTDNILILGGYDKGLSYEPLIPVLDKSTVRLLVLMGDNRKKILKVLNKYCKEKKKPFSCKIIEASDFRSAIKLSYAFARSYKGITSMRIIFSPATSSFDMFRNYADRGEKFKELVRKLK